MQVILVVAFSQLIRLLVQWLTSEAAQEQLISKLKD